MGVWVRAVFDVVDSWSSIADQTVQPVQPVDGFDGKAKSFTMTEHFESWNKAGNRRAYDLVRSVMEIDQRQRRVSKVIYS